VNATTLVRAGAAVGVLAWAAAASPATPSYVPVKVDSPSPQAQAGTGGGFGARVGVLGDLNRDGTNDLFVTSPALDLGGAPDVGRVWILDGRTRQVLATVDHPAPQGGSLFGFAAAGLGDVNGDGAPDLAVAAPGQNVDANTDQGKVYVFSGRDRSLLYARNDPDPQAAAEFGRALLATGDLNGDGVADFVVGAPRQDSSSNTKVGAAYAFSGRDGSFLYRLSPPEDQHNGRFGQGLADPGDLNGDGVDEIVVGAPRVDGVGRAYVFDGRTGRLLLVLNDPQPQQGAVFGLMVGERGAPGDVNGDGVPDVLVPAPLENAGGVAGAGRAYLFSGRDGSPIRALDDPTPDTAGMFGFAFAPAGDANRDGKPDLLAGQAPFADPTAPDVGGAYVFDPRTGGVLLAFENPTGQHGSDLGASVASPGDLNGDGRPDYVVAAPRMDVGGNADQGEVLVFESRDGTRPSAPTVRGPRRTKLRAPVYVLSATDPDDPPGRLTYLCAFDSARLHACPAHVVQRLRPGVHVLRVEARDPAGNTGPQAVLRITVR
jgi:FG-GAP repeat